MSKKLYVGNIPFSTTAADLLEAFGNFGTVTQAQIVSDRETGRSRGFAFVEMADGADEAIANLNGAQFQGRTLTVNEAKPREDRPRGGGGRDRDRGGYGGGGGRRWEARTTRTETRGAAGSRLPRLLVFLRREGRTEVFLGLCYRFICCICFIYLIYG